LDPEEDEEELTNRINLMLRDDLSQFATKLNTTKKVSTIFPQQPCKELLRIIVELPDAGECEQLIVTKHY
jgi:hypothetical protein